MFVILHYWLNIIVQVYFQVYSGVYLPFSTDVVQMHAQVEHPPIILITYLTRCRCSDSWCMYHTIMMLVSSKHSGNRVLFYVQQNITQTCDEVYIKKLSGRMRSARVADRDPEILEKSWIHCVLPDFVSKWDPAGSGPRIRKIYMKNWELDSGRFWRSRKLWWPFAVPVHAGYITIACERFVTTEE